MKILHTLGLVLLAAALSSCCPGSMMGGGVANVVPPPKVAAPQPVDSDGDGVPDALDKCPNTPRGVAVNADGCSIAQLAAMAPPPSPPPPPAPAPAPTRVEQELATRGQIRLENVYFETNSSRLTPESSAPLDEAGAALEKFPSLKIEVEGHTDPRGAAAYNVRLSQARAESVRKYLLSHFKLSPDQLTAKGYGSAHNESSGTTPAELKRDRRVVLTVVNPEALPKSIDIKR